MISQVQEFVTGRAAALANRVKKVRLPSLTSARDAVRNSADSVRSLKTPIHAVARSGIRLTSVSQAFSQNLIELQSDMFSAAISDAALRLERASRAGNIVELFRGQIELLPATRTRLGTDAQRAADIFREAGREVRAVATQTYGKIVDSAAEAATAAKRKPRKTAARKATKVRKSTRRARKAA
jgi:hypothetical protein